MQCCVSKWEVQFPGSIRNCSHLGQKKIQNHMISIFHSYNLPKNFKLIASSYLFYAFSSIFY